MDLLSVFRSLPRPSGASGPDTFNVIAVGGDHRVGKDGVGAPILIVNVNEGHGPAVGPIVLRHVAVQHSVTCRLSVDGRTPFREEVVSMVRCSSTEPALREFFLRALEVGIVELGSRPTRAHVNRVIRQMVELFRAFEEPARRAAQGLWAELFVIERASSPDVALSSWHADIEEAFDFSNGPARLEVKSFCGPERVHTFALRQIRPGADVNAVVASLLVERSSGGLTIADLMRRISERNVNEEHIFKLHRIVASSLGESAPTALLLPFDFERAEDSLRFFEAALVPSIEPPLPEGVIGVRVTSSLERVPALASRDLSAHGAFFAAFLPR